MNMQNYYPSWLNASYYQNIPHNEVNWAHLAQQWMAMRGQQQEGPVAIPYQPPTASNFGQSAQAAQNQQQQQQQGAIPFNPPTPVDPSANFRQQKLPVADSASPIQPPQPATPTQQLMAKSYPSPIPDAAPAPRPFFGRRPSENFPVFPSSKMPEENSNMTALMGGPMHPGLLPTPYHNHHRTPVFPLAPGSSYDYGNYGPMGAMPRPLFGRPMPPRMRMPPPEFYLARENKFESLGAAFANQYSSNFEEEEFYTHQDMDYRKWKPPLFSEEEHEEYYDEGGFSSGSMFGSSALDVQQRKNLPAWIREGLEKVEREKAKQKEKEEQEKFLKEQEVLKKTKKKKSRFESDSEDDEKESIDDEEDHQKMEDDEIPHHKDGATLSTDNEDDEKEELSLDDQKAELMSKLRIWLTEILMTVTTSEIEKIVQETLKSKKSASLKSKRAQPQVLAQSSAALATIIGLGSDQESTSEDEHSDDDQSENGDASTASDTPNQTLDSPKSADSGDSSADGQGPDDFFKRPMLPPPGVSKRKVTASGGTVTSVSATTPASSTSIIERITQTAQKEQSEMPLTGFGAENGPKNDENGENSKQIDKKLTDNKSGSLKKSSSSTSKSGRSHSKSSSSSSKSKSSSRETSRSESKEKLSSSSSSKSKSGSKSSSRDASRSRSKEKSSKSSSHETSRETKSKEKSSSSSKSDRDRKRKRSRSKSRDKKSRYRSKSRSPPKSFVKSRKSRSRSKSRDSKSAKSRRKSKSRSPSRKISLSKTY